MTDVPSEYKSPGDFGFSAHEEPPTREEEQEDQSKPGIDEVLEAVSHISVQLGEVLSAVRTQNNISSLSRTEAEYNADIDALEKLIVPLLTQLINTASQDWIHWPNRKVLIENQRDAILAITRKGK